MAAFYWLFKKFTILNKQMKAFPIDATCNELMKILKFCLHCLFVSYCPTIDLSFSGDIFFGHVTSICGVVK